MFLCSYLRPSELSTPMCCGELRRWSHGSYTLLHDAEAAQAEYALDLILPFGYTGEPKHKTQQPEDVSLLTLTECFVPQTGRQSSGGSRVTLPMRRMRRWVSALPEPHICRFH